MQTVNLPGGERWPSLGLGTWRMGERVSRRSAELAALRQALALGYRLFDTAEMYAEGGAESLLGQALADALRAGELRREQVQVVSKFYPHNAEPAAMLAACEASRRRLQLDCIDLYLLHWRGNVALQRTLDGLQSLQQRGWIRHWGVSNFDLEDMQELTALPGGQACAANQVYYCAGERGVELALLPWQRQQAVPVMAYCPLGEGQLASHSGLQLLAAEHGLSAAQLALAWLLAQPGVMAIPKAVQAQHLQQNWLAAQQALPASLLQAVGQLCPAPRRRGPLAMA